MCIIRNKHAISKKKRNEKIKKLVSLLIFWTHFFTSKKTGYGSSMMEIITFNIFRAGGGGGGRGARERGEGGGREGKKKKTKTQKKKKKKKKKVEEHPQTNEREKERRE